MKIRLMDFLVCPQCLGDEFKLTVWEEEKNYFPKEKENNFGREIIEGFLECKSCNNLYPIIAGIPRMLIGSLKESLQSDHKDFFRKHP